MSHTDKEERVDTVVEIASRLRDGRAVETTKDLQQWRYEYLDRVMQDWGTDSVPLEVFPAIVRVMVEWCDALEGCRCEPENAQALAAAIGELTRCLQRCLAAWEERK